MKPLENSTGSELHGVLAIPAKEYHDGPGVSKSMLDDIAPPSSPLHFWARHIAKLTPKKETDAMKIGTVIHACVLEPDVAHDTFYVSPPGHDGRTKAGKEWNAEHADKLVISQEQWRDIQGMREAVWAHPMARALLEGCQTERSLYATDRNGLLRRCRLDALKEGNFLPDLKSLTSADLDSIERAIADRRYYVQGAYYVDLCNMLGMDKQTFVLICVEKTAPYDVVCKEINATAMEAGRKCYQRDLHTLRRCRENNTWPGRSPEAIEPAGLPSWLSRQLESELS